jgi:hypothetical protein
VNTKIVFLARKARKKEEKREGKGERGAMFAKRSKIGGGGALPLF